MSINMYDNNNSFAARSGQELEGTPIGYRDSDMDALDLSRAGAFDDFFDFSMNSLEQEMNQPDLRDFAEQLGFPTTLPTTSKYQAEQPLEGYLAGGEAKEARGSPVAARAAASAPSTSGSPSLPLPEAKLGTPTGRGSRRSLDEMEALPEASPYAESVDTTATKATPESAPRSEPKSRKRSRGGAAKGEKTEKGLRTFATKVCDKVQQKGKTTYNAVADELVKEGDLDIDDKNIRRRVYDALNVLKAMDIIAQDKKEISWKGLPSVVSSLEEEQAKQRCLRVRIDGLQKVLKEQLDYHSSLANLIRHNDRSRRFRAAGAGAAGAGAAGAEPQQYRIPFTLLGHHTQHNEYGQGSSFCMKDDRVAEFTFTTDEWCMILPPDLLTEMAMEREFPAETKELYDLCTRPPNPHGAPPPQPSPHRPYPYQ